MASHDDERRLPSPADDPVIRGAFPPPDGVQLIPRGPGRPKAAADLDGTERTESDVSENDLEGFISKTRFRERLPFEVCRAAYSDLYWAEEFARKRPDNSDAKASAQKELEKVRREFPRDVRGFALRLLRTFPSDERAVATITQGTLPDIALRGTFIRQMWDSEEGKGGAKRAVETLGLLRLPAKMSEIRRKLVRRKLFATARFIALPLGAIAGSYAKKLLAHESKSRWLTLVAVGQGILLVVLASFVIRAPARPDQSLSPVGVAAAKLSATASGSGDSAAAVRSLRRHPAPDGDVAAHKSSPTGTVRPDAANVSVDPLWLRLSGHALMGRSPVGGLSSVSTGFRTCAITPQGELVLSNGEADTCWGRVARSGTIFHCNRNDVLGVAQVVGDDRGSIVYGDVWVVDGSGLRAVSAFTLCAADSVEECRSPVWIEFDTVSVEEIAKSACLGADAEVCRIAARYDWALPAPPDGGPVPFPISKMSDMSRLVWLKDRLP